jgi:hypothetical protein
VGEQGPEQGRRGRAEASSVSSTGTAGSGAGGSVIVSGMISPTVSPRAILQRVFRPILHIADLAHACSTCVRTLKMRGTLSKD